MSHPEELLLEDLSIPIETFIEYRALNESFQNFLPSDVEKKTSHAKEVFDLLGKSYADQGGIKGSGFNSPEDMVKKIPMWKLSKQDGKVTAASLYKDTQGRKRVAMGSDGTPAGKKSAGEMMSADLKRSRAHMEISGKSLSFMKKQLDIAPHLHTYDSAEKFHLSRGDTISRPTEDDPEVVRHPELKDHMYVRKIAGHSHTKVMLGTMGKTITEELKRTKEEEKEFGKDSSLKQGGHQYGNWAFDSGLHGPVRAKERQPKWSTDDWHDLIGRGHEALTNPSKQIVDKGKTHFKLTGPAPVMVYSRSKQQGVILRVSPKNDQNPKLGGSSRIETIPPYKASYVSPGTHKIIIEGIEILSENVIIID